VGLNSNNSGSVAVVVLEGQGDSKSGVGPLGEVSGIAANAPAAGAQGAPDRVPTALGVQTPNPAVPAARRASCSAGSGDASQTPLRGLSAAENLLQGGQGCPHTAARNASSSLRPWRKRPGPENRFAVTAAGSGRSTQPPPGWRRLRRSTEAQEPEGDEVDQHRRTAITHPGQGDAGTGRGPIVMRY